MPSLCFLLALLIFQQYVLTGAHPQCGTDIVMEKYLKEHPEDRQSFEYWSHPENYKRGSSSGEKLTIPVVFHVLYNVQGQNIPNQTILSQIAVLNQDFNRHNPDRQNTRAMFQNLVGSSDIQFVLATADPNGAPTTGINRHYVNRYSFPDPSSSQFAYDCQLPNRGGVAAWPRDYYLNFEAPPVNEGSTLGYALFPGSSSAEIDGVVINTPYFGTSNRQPHHLGRTATHEVGHWLSLHHTWGPNLGSCDEDDGVEDTPNSSRPNYDCIYRTSCGSPDMIENYMDYSDDNCMNAFTRGQNERMRSVLLPGGFRNSVLVNFTGDPYGITGNLHTPSDGDDDLLLEFPPWIIAVIVVAIIVFILIALVAGVVKCVFR